MDKLYFLPFTCKNTNIYLITIFELTESITAYRFNVTLNMIYLEIIHNYYIIKYNIHVLKITMLN